MTIKETIFSTFLSIFLRWRDPEQLSVSPLVATQLTGEKKGMGLLQIVLPNSPASTNCKNKYNTILINSEACVDPSHIIQMNTINYSSCLPKGLIGLIDPRIQLTTFLFTKQGRKMTNRSTDELIRKVDEFCDFTDRFGQLLDEYKARIDEKSKTEKKDSGLMDKGQQHFDF